MFSPPFSTLRRGLPIGDPGRLKLSITTVWINLYGTLGHVAASDEWSYLSVESSDSEPENELILHFVFGIEFCVLLFVW